MAQARRAFTIRFDNEETHRRLALVADSMGVSMNQLAESMIEQELDAASLALEEDLTHTLGLLAARRVDPSADIARVARAEASVPDPIRARRVHPDVDPLGVAAAFAGARRPR